MYDPANDEFGGDHFNELLREAEQQRLVHSVQPQQPSLLSRLQSQLGI